MSHLEDIAGLAEQTAIQIACDQWARIGFRAGGATDGPELSLVDPEALLLLSLYLAPGNDRLKAALKWWARLGSTLTSIQRVRGLTRMFPPVVERRIARLATLASTSGDRRWKVLTKQPSSQASAPAEAPSSTMLAAPVDVMKPALLIMRVRLLFGVGPKADVITCLLSRGGQTATARQLLETTVYGRTTVYRILDELSAAGVVARTKAWPATFQICSEAWQEVFGRAAIQKGVNRKAGFRRGYLENTAAPMWLCWPQLFSYLATLAEACRVELRQIRAREPDLDAACRMYSGYRRAFVEQRLVVPTLYAYWPRETEGLEVSLHEIGRWYRKHA